MASAKVTQNKNDNDTKRLPKYYSFDFIKENIKEKSIKSLDRDILSKFCAKLQLKTSGTKETLIVRLAPLQDDTLFDKRIHLIDRQFKFATSLPRESVPPPTACWKFEASLFPKIGQSEIHEYQSQKRQGRQGQYRKAYRMFQSRRMKHIKVLQGEGATKYIKASVLKSFSTDVTRTVTVVFEENKPRKAFCECPVGACGLCCHAILVLLQLKHFTEHKQFLLALTCTQKLQKWHRPGVSDKVKAKAKIASHIRLKYFRNVRSARKDIFHKRSKKKIGQNSSSGTLNDIDKSDWYTRDVENIDSQVQDRLHRINVNISNHFMKCLKKYKIQSGLSQHLAYKNAYLCRIIQKEHDYAQRSVCYNEALLKPKHTGKAQDIWHGALTHTTPMNPRNNNNECFFSSAKAKDLLTLLNSQSNDEILSVKLPKCDEKINIIDGNNYVDVAQGSREWFASRIGIITASKLPALLGLNGNKEFDAAWFCINNKLDENVYRPKHFKNFERGKKFENAALSNFTKVSGAPVLGCGFFRHPEDPRYGASPDGIGEAFAIEVKTRAQHSETPLEKISGSHLVQTNFQMACTKGDITFIQSYLPEKDISHFFYVERNDLLINVVKHITDHILEKRTFTDWHYDEHCHLKRLGVQLMGSTATFERLRPLRSWINGLAKDVKQVTFC